MQPRWLVLVSTLCAGIALGFIAGKGSGHQTVSRGGEKIESRVRSPRADRLPSGTADIAGKTGSGSVSRSGGMPEGHLPASSPELARELVRLENLPVGERAAETMLLFARWGEVDPLAALARANEYGVAGEAARCEVLKSWSAQDPRAAADWFGGNACHFAGVQKGRSVSEREIVSSVIARAWARQDPEAALAWAATRGDEAVRCVGSVLGETAVGNPALAIRLAESADASFLKSASGEIAGQWAASDFSAAEKWIRTLPADCQDGAMAKAVRTLSLSDPAKAAGLLDTLGDGVERERVVAVVMRQLAKENRSAAERWLDSQTSETARRSGAIGLVSAMALEDAAGVRGFLDTLEPGPVRDGAAAAYIRSAASAKPEDLLELAGGLSNDADRGQSIALVITRWRQEDPEAAERYIIGNLGSAAKDE